jgi:hypothetical protein
VWINRVCLRFSQFLDFLPWRLLNIDVSGWADRDHPYYGNYLGQKRLIELAKKHKVGRFVRLTGLGLAYSAFNPIGILFNTLLSCNNRWGLKCEEALAKSNVPYVILRPGGLSDSERNYETTNIQIDASGKLPFPGRIGRADVAALCVAATELPPGMKFTLACRGVGTDVKPRPQGVKEDGCATAKECMERLVKSNATNSAWSDPLVL